MSIKICNSSQHFTRVPEGIITVILGDKVQEMDPELGRLLNAMNRKEKLNMNISSSISS